MSSHPVAAELVIQNARIYTLDPKKPWVEALAIRHGQFMATGSLAEMTPLIDDATKVVDFAGRIVLPGLIDGHCHAFEGARAALFELALSPRDDFDQIIERVRAAAAVLPDGQWLKGGGWEGRKLLPILSHPDALKRLDEATGHRPTVLRDISFHTLFVNTAAMRAAGIDRNTKVPDHGGIVLDENGDPVGLLLETASSLIFEAMPSLSAGEVDAVIRHAGNVFNSCGITGLAHAVTSAQTMQGFRDADRRGELTVRVATFISTHTPVPSERDGTGPSVIDRRQDYASQYVNVDFVKYFMDGVAVSMTAAFKAPYRSVNGGRAQSAAPFYSVEELRNLILPLDAQGISVKIHAIGDLAITHTLDAIEQVRAANGFDGPQHSIAHLTYIDSDDIKRLSSLNVLADLCPPMWFPGPILNGSIQLLGEERSHRGWPVRDIINSGAAVTIGSDWPAVAPSPNPWPGLSALITREDPWRANPGVFRPEQSITLEEALPLYTINAAESIGFGESTGSIETGKAADFIILDRDIFSIDPRDIAETKVLATYFAGKPVYQSD
ncbi:amidohydrolase [Agrobacterium sp. rho-13.3]|uniref:amidohydrolase n=1 Tax=Agrobacterium sp. rho-13.3 TaxID=3072980 RepID=UPI002A14B6B4|nr:amidohydrolase [Agrobacterium sp. rho-13.3]MDX8310869.1 amidohydrolase [Agrobacterium sp. rho-13.3]